MGEMPLDEEIFKNPPVSFRGIPFWSWNCKITEELIDWQLDCFKEMGFGGVDIHPRSGLDTEYLGEEYMQMIRYTVEKCREKGLLCWLYDEDRFPSGAAGGIVTKDWHMRGRYLWLTKRYAKEESRPYLLPGFAPDREAFETAIDGEGEKPSGYYACAYAITFSENGPGSGCYLKQYRRLWKAREIGEALEGEEEVWFAYVKLMEEEHWFEDQTYVDTMNPKAIRAFLDVTHEAYYHYVGEEFGKQIPAIFTDEPRIGKHPQISFSDSHEDVTLPYTEFFAEQMKKRYGMDPLDIVPEYVWELEGGKKSVGRYRYRETACECFVQSYMDQIGAWCREHGIAMTGHVLSEDSLTAQSVTVGDCMRCYRSMDLPGIDVLVDKREFVTAKQASSVARQYGKAGVVSELYGVTHWDCDFKTYKLQGDWQAALGVTHRVPHLSYMSMAGEAKRDWPASIFYQSPWYREYPYIEDYFARLNTVLTRGKAAVRIGVIHPVESAWLEFGPNDQTLAARREMDRMLDELVRWMLYDTLDFDLLSEALLPDLCGNKNSCEDGRLHVGQMAYEAVVVPEMTTIRSTTLSLLEQFQRRGGTLIFMGTVPHLVDGEESGRAEKLAEKSTVISRSRERLEACLEDCRDVEIRESNGSRSRNLLYQLREEGTDRWLFCCHGERKNNRISRCQRYRIGVRGCFVPEQYDALDGSKKEIPYFQKGGWTYIPWAAYGEDSLLLHLKKAAEDEKSGNTAWDALGFPILLAWETAAVLEQPVEVLREEPNVMLLDYAGFQVDDGVVWERQEILRADNAIRNMLGFLPREERMNQPWFLEEKEAHKVVLYYEVEAEAEMTVSLAMEKPENCRIVLNGEEMGKKDNGCYVDPAIRVAAVLPLKKGTNHLKLEMPYHQKTELENMYLLGTFDVEAGFSRSVLKPQRRCVQMGDITRQGMPFYTGNLQYRFRFDAPKKQEYFLHVPHFKAPLLTVFVDGRKKGRIAYAPHRLSLGTLEEGVHEVTVCLYGNRFNGFGTLHNANEEYTWYGQGSYRTIGDDWTDAYLVRPVGILSSVLVEVCR